VLNERKFQLLNIAGSEFKFIAGTVQSVCNATRVLSGLFVTRQCFSPVSECKLKTLHVRHNDDAGDAFHTAGHANYVAQSSHSCSFSVFQSNLRGEFFLSV